MVVVLIVFCLRRPETKAARPERPAFGRRTWVSVPQVRGVTFSAPAQAHTPARVRRRRPGCCETANPRSASSGLISPIADRGGPDLAGHAEGLVGQTGAQAARVISSRPVNANAYSGPAPAWHRRPLRRRWRPDSHRASHRVVVPG
jgi:hypothetical protein